MPRKPERKSRMTPEALDELSRRYKAGEDMSGPFSLKTGRPIAMSPELRAINDEIAKLNFRRRAEKNERRYDEYGEFRCLAFAEGWVMYRRKGAATGAMTLKEWDALSVCAIRLVANGGGR